MKKLGSALATSTCIVRLCWYGDPRAEKLDETCCGTLSVGLWYNVITENTILVRVIGLKI